MSKYQKKKDEIKKKLKKNIDDLDIKDKKKLRAIAIKYDADKGKAPRIVATGRGMVAEDIVKLADDNKIPLYEDESLANLLGKLELETEIPQELFSVVAEILAFIYQLDQMSKKRSKIREKFAKLK